MTVISYFPLIASLDDVANALIGDYIRTAQAYAADPLYRVEADARLTDEQQQKLLLDSQNLASRLRATLDYLAELHPLPGSVDLADNRQLWKLRLDAVVNRPGRNRVLVVPDVLSSHLVVWAQHELSDAMSCTIPGYMDGLQALHRDLTGEPYPHAVVCMVPARPEPAPEPDAQAAPAEPRPC